MKVLKLTDLPVLSVNDSLFAAKAKLINTGLPVVVLDSRRGFKGIIDEYVILRNMFKHSDLKSVAVVPPAINLSKPVESQLSKIRGVQTRCYAAYERGKFAGIILREDLMYSVKNLFAAKRAKEVIRDLIIVSSKEPYISIIHKINHGSVRTIAVVENNNIIGFIRPIDLISLSDVPEKAVIESSKTGASGLSAGDIMVQNVPVIDEKGSLERAIDALLSTPYGIITSNGRPVGSISLSSIMAAYREPSPVDLSIDGLTIEEADMAYPKIIKVLEKIAKKHQIRSAHLYVKKQGHRTCILRLSIGHDHFIQEQKSLDIALSHIIEALKRRYLRK